MTSRVFENLSAPNEIEIVSGNRDETNSQGSSTQKNVTEASDRDSDGALEIYEGGNSGKGRYTSR